jgi:hypothetical protein
MRMPRHLQETTLPTNLAKPVQRALSDAGIGCLDQLCSYSEDEIRQLHGIGPNAFEQLTSALSEKGLSFAEEDTITA